jgi:PAS domain S-box-containing protein
MSFVHHSFTASTKKTAESEQSNALRFQILLEQIPIPLCHVDQEGRFLFINHYFQQAFGYTLDDVATLEMWWQRAYPDPIYRAWVQATWNEAVQEASATRQMIRPVSYRVTRQDGSIRHMLISGITLGDDFLATFVDVTETQEQQQLLSFSNQILQQISEDEPLPQVLETICRVIEQVNPGIRCSLLLIDADGLHIHHGAAPSLPVAYASAIDGIAIGPSVGSCGTAMYRKESVFSPDIQGDALWVGFKDLATVYDLAACWSSPIFSSAGEVIGTFGIYWSSSHPQVTDLLKHYVETTTFVASIAIENDLRKQRLERQLQELQRWQRVTLDREDRILELKEEVNTLLLRLGESPRYGQLQAQLSKA